MGYILHRLVNVIHRWWYKPRKYLENTHLAWQDSCSVKYLSARHNHKKLYTETLALRCLNYPIYSCISSINSSIMNFGMIHYRFTLSVPFKIAAVDILSLSIFFGKKIRRAMQTTYNADDLQEILNLTSASLLINIWRMSSAAVLKAARRVKQCNVEKGIKGNGLLCFQHLSESHFFAWRFTQKK